MNAQVDMPAQGFYVCDIERNGIYAWEGLTAEQKTTRVVAGIVLLALLHGPVLTAFRLLKSEILSRLSGIDSGP